MSDEVGRAGFLHRACAASYAKYTRFKAGESIDKCDSLGARTSHTQSCYGIPERKLIYEKNVKLRNLNLALATPRPITSAAYLVADESSMLTQT